MLRSIIRDYGAAWAINRGLYALKLKMLSAVPATGVLFERDVDVVRLDLFDSVIDFDAEARFLKALPKGEREDILSRADRAAVGTVDGFSSVELRYGNPPDWFRNPMTGASIDPSLEWFRIPDFSKEAGDIKVYWEISRYTHLLLLARAALLGDGERYHVAFSRQVADWVASNGYGHGPNYKCGQEASLRMLNVLMAYSCFRYLRMATSEDEASVKAIVEGSYKKVLSNFFYARKCIRNNHTLSEACGMYVGAWCCGDKRTMARALSYFEEAVLFQFREDGGYVQWSFNYQRFALQICEALIAVTCATGDGISDECLARIARSTELLYQFQDATTGWLPNYGSNDGALPFPLSQCDFRDYSPTINAIYAFLLGGVPYERSLLCEEAVWFGAPHRDDRLHVPRGSGSYAGAGLAILRDDDTFVTLCAQEYRRNRPGHMDQLHVDVWHGGRNVLCDGGTYSYASEEGVLLASTGAHNTVRLVDTEQMTMRPPFLVMDWGRRGEFSLAGHAMAAEESFAAGYTHRREVGLKDGMVTIADTVTGDDRRLRELRFHTTCVAEVCGDHVRLGDESGKTVAMIMPDADGLVSMDIESGITSPRYLCAERCNVVVVRYGPGIRTMVTAICLLD